MIINFSHFFPPYRRAYKGAPGMVFASMYTSDGGHARRLYDHDYYKPPGHREGEIAGATVRQYVQCV